MAKQKETQTKEVQDKYTKNVEVTLTETAVAKNAPYYGKKKEDKKKVTITVAENGKRLGYFK